MRSRIRLLTLRTFLAWVRCLVGRLVPIVLAATAMTAPVPSKDADLRCENQALLIEAFGGSTVTEAPSGDEQVVHLWLTVDDRATQHAVLDALRQECPERYDTAQVVLHHARYSLKQLLAWQREATSVGGAENSVALTYIDRELNVVVVGVREVARDGDTVASQLTRRGVPPEGFQLVEADVRAVPESENEAPVPVVAAFAAGVGILAVLVGFIAFRIRGRLLRRRTGY